MGPQCHCLGNPQGLGCGSLGPSFAGSLPGLHPPPRRAAQNPACPKERPIKEVRKPKRGLMKAYDAFSKCTPQQLQMLSEVRMGRDGWMNGWVYGCMNG